MFYWFHRRPDDLNHIIFLFYFILVIVSLAFQSTTAQKVYMKTAIAVQQHREKNDNFSMAGITVKEALHHFLCECSALSVACWKIQKNSKIKKNSYKFVHEK